MKYKIKWKQKLRGKHKEKINALNRLAKDHSNGDNLNFSTELGKLAHHGEWPFMGIRIKRDKKKSIMDTGNSSSLFTWELKRNLYRNLGKEWGGDGKKEKIASRNNAQCRASKEKCKKTAKNTAEDVLTALRILTRLMKLWGKEHWRCTNNEKNAT